MSKMEELSKILKNAKAKFGSFSWITIGVSFLPPANEVCRKVMLLHLSVILFIVGVYPSMQWRGVSASGSSWCIPLDTPSPGHIPSTHTPWTYTPRQTPPWTPPQADTPPQRKREVRILLECILVSNKIHISFLEKFEPRESMKRYNLSNWILVSAKEMCTLLFFFTDRSSRFVLHDNTTIKLLLLSDCFGFAKSMAVHFMYRIYFHDINDYRTNNDGDLFVIQCAAFKFYKQVTSTTSN